MIVLYYVNMTGSSHMQHWVDLSHFDKKRWFPLAKIDLGIRRSNLVLDRFVLGLIRGAFSFWVEVDYMLYAYINTHKKMTMTIYSIQLLQHIQHFLSKQIGLETNSVHGSAYRVFWGHKYCLKDGRLVISGHQTRTKTTRPLRSLLRPGAR